MPPQPPKPSQSFTDKRTYIPPRVQQVLDRRAAEQPLQPQSIEPSGQADPSPPPAPPPAPLFPPSQAQPETGPAKDYDFIFNPQKPAKRPWLSGGDSLPKRAMLITGGVLVLIIIFVIVKSLLGSGSGATFTAFVSVIQDQQELIHLSTNAGQQTNLTTGNKNFAATAQLSLTSSQAALGKYIATSGHKLNDKTLNLKVSASLDNQLTNAATAATYDQTFRQIAKSQLTTYMNDMSHAYKLTKGSKGRGLLNDDFNQAQLLLNQLNSSPASP